ncbi:hypothetical protein SISNIDRAFT_459898 [Sistotremastrum niveocremeum HHB9708]|uniref:Uncharacterized protein n=1 Tax=Sistotremastrum niveocremeum HHB9708 TaxID=1314777 RepID=A0A164P6P9_9AGAM|nr:hypothetical protein SISNIDRAFT_459898 [Sistotremastrum niveocremeum HHB9708]
MENRQHDADRATPAALKLQRQTSTSTSGGVRASEPTESPGLTHDAATAITRYLSPDDLPKVSEHVWPRVAAKLQRFNFAEAGSTIRELAAPGDGFIEDPDRDLLLIPQSRADGIRILVKILTRVFTSALDSLHRSRTKVPHYSLQNELREHGLVIINWPYGVRAAFSVRAAASTYFEMKRLIRAFLHPNPASRAQVVSRHHFPPGTHPGYISYVSSFDEDPRKRIVVDEDYMHEDPLPPLVRHRPVGQCLCHLATCNPLDLSDFINERNELVDPEPNEDLGPKHPEKRASEDLPSPSRRSKQKSDPQPPPPLPLNSDPGTRLPNHTLAAAKWANLASDGLSLVLNHMPTSDVPSGAPSMPLAASSPSPPLQSNVLEGNGVEADAAPHGSPHPLSDDNSAPVRAAERIASPPSVIDLCSSSPEPFDPADPTEELSEAMTNVRSIQKLTIDNRDKEEFASKILNKLSCIPPTPVLPPLTESDWSDVVQLAKIHHVDEAWFRNRMKQWISHLLKISVVPLKHLAVTVRATQKLVQALKPHFGSKFDHEIKGRILMWWINVIQPGASRRTYNEAWCLLGELSDLHDLTCEDADKIEVYWKEVYRLSLQDSTQ